MKVWVSQGTMHELYVEEGSLVDSVLDLVFGETSSIDDNLLDAVPPAMTNELFIITDPEAARCLTSLRYAVLSYFQTPFS